MTRGAVGVLALVLIASVLGIGALIALRPHDDASPAASASAVGDERSPEAEQPVDARMVAAQREARAFAEAYVALSYGRGGVRAIDLPHASSALVARLQADPGRVTPAQQSGRPEVLGVSAIRTGAQRASATASVRDSRTAVPYGLSFSLEDTVSGWLVTAIGGH